MKHSYGPETRNYGPIHLFFYHFCFKMSESMNTLNTLHSAFFLVFTGLVSFYLTKWSSKVQTRLKGFCMFFVKVKINLFYWLGGEHLFFKASLFFEISDILTNSEALQYGWFHYQLRNATLLGGPNANIEGCWMGHDVC